jgi:secreted PhoX family phosphatase
VGSWLPSSVSAPSPVPDGFEWSTIIAWGDPILPGAPAFDFENQTAAAQAGQFGYNNDYTTIMRSGSENSALLVCNQEYTNDELMFRGYTGSAGLTPERHYRPRHHWQLRRRRNGLGHSACR